MKVYVVTEDGGYNGENTFADVFSTKKGLVGFFEKLRSEVKSYELKEYEKFMTSLNVWATDNTDKSFSNLEATPNGKLVNVSSFDGYSFEEREAV